MAPRRTRGPRPPPTWGGSRREGAPRCSSGGSPSQAAAVAGAAAAPVAPSSQLPVGHASSAVVAKVAGGRSSASFSSGYFSPRDDVSTSSLQSLSMSSPSGCSPRQPGLDTCVADAGGADAVVGASSGYPAALPSSLPEEEEPLSPAHQMEVASPEVVHMSRIQEEYAIQMVVAKFMVWYFDAHKKRTLSTDDLKSITPALKMEVAIDVLFRLDLASKKRVLSASELDLIIRLKSYVEDEEEEDEEEEEVSKGAARGGEMQAVHPKLHRCSKVPLWDFDPMLVEVEACLTKRPEKKEEDEHHCSEVPLWDFDPMLVEVEACLSKRPQEEEEEHCCSEVPLWDFDPMLVEVEACLTKRLQREELEEEEEEFISLSSMKEIALKIMFRLDLAREMRVLSVDELDLYDDMKSLLPRIEAEIGEDNANGVDAKAKEDNVDGADGVEEEEEEDSLLLALQKEVTLQMAVAKFVVFYLDGHEKRMVSTDEVKSISPALKKEVAIEVLFQLDLARKKRILSANELDLIIHLKSQLPCLEAEIGEVNAHWEDVEVADVQVEEEEEPLSPSCMMQAALKIIFRLDLAREMRILSIDELDLYGDMKSILPLLEAEIGEDNADGLDVVEDEKAKEEEDNANEVDAVEQEEEEEEEQPLSAAVRKEIAIEILFQFELARKKRTLSAGELDLISFVKSQLARLEAEIGEVNEEEEEEEPLSPALEMEAALKMMFRLDLAREMRTLSADELDLYDEMKSLLPCLEAEIREAGTALSITLEDPPSCQLHAPSIVPLAGANEVLSPMVPSASTFIKLSADLQLAEHSSVVATNAELSRPGPEATPSVLKSSAEPEPAVEDDEITEALYRHSVRRHRLQIFRDICPE